MKMRSENVKKAIIILSRLLETSRKESVSKLFF